jgi:hypothetical protein
MPFYNPFEEKKILAKRLLGSSAAALAALPERTCRERRFLVAWTVHYRAHNAVQESHDWRLHVRPADFARIAAA